MIARPPPSARSPYACHARYRPRPRRPVRHRPGPLDRLLPRGAGARDHPGLARRGSALCLSGRRWAAVPDPLAAEQRGLRAAPGRTASSGLPAADPRGGAGHGGQAPGAWRGPALRRGRAAPGRRRLGRALLHRSRRDPARGLQPRRCGRPGGAGARCAVLRVLLMATFHEGELEVQRRAGVAANAEKIGRSILREVPEIARRFAEERRFIVVGAADPDARVWATLLQGPEGFVSAPAEDRLQVAARPPAGDPLAEALAKPVDVGTLLIDPATRRRMRLNGRASPAGDGGFIVETREV